MIVKNEGKNMKRCLQNVKKYIDYYVICDTGSTDNTIEIIREELKDIPGEILQHEWKNFGYNRTLGLKCAEGKADYLIICDADEVLVFDNFKKENLKHDSYSIRYTGFLDYSFVAIVKNNLDWRYVGVTHEYIASPMAKTASELKEVKIMDFGDGGSKSNKFTRDIELLTQGLKDEPDNVRYMFYLANSYKDSGIPLMAIPWYQKRIDAGVWIEEVTCSYEYMGLCFKMAGQVDEAIKVWLDGYNYNPRRAECIYHAAEAYMQRSDYKNAYELLIKAEKISYPKNDHLFIKSGIYKYLIDYQLSICTFYADMNRDIRHKFTMLLDEPAVNRTNVLSNYKWYCKHVEDCVEKTIFFPPQIKMSGFNNSSPSILKVGDEYLVNIRNVDYMLHHENGGFFNTKESCNSINSFIRYDKNFNIIEYKIFKEPELNQKIVNGIHDIRIYLEDNNIKFIGTKDHEHSEFLTNIGMVYGDYDLKKETLEYKKIEPHSEPYLVDKVKTNICEKNWVPFEHNGITKFIYKWDPIQIGVLKEGEKTTLEIIDKKNSFIYSGRGSTPGVRVNNEIWFIVHIVDYNNGPKRKYYHQLVVLDYETLELKRKSNLFNFVGNDYEYCLGMVVEDDRIIVCHNVHESSSYIKIYNRQSFLAKIFANLGI
jgi:tetratricopeptide (TPR) repeat protein